MIKHLHLLELSVPDKERLELCAKLLQSMSNLQFEILAVKDECIELRVTQGHCLSESYASWEALLDVTWRLFEPYVNERVILCDVIPYEDLRKRSAIEN